METYSPITICPFECAQKPIIMGTPYPNNNVTTLYLSFQPMSSFTTQQEKVPLETTGAYCMYNLQLHNSQSKWNNMKIVQFKIA